MKLIVDKEHKGKFVINFLVLAFSLYGISVTRFDYRSASAFERWMLDSFAPIQRAVTGFQSGVVNFFDAYIANVNAVKESKVLSKKAHFLEEKIFELKEIERENHRLKKLLEFGRAIKAKRVLAQVVSWDASSDFKVIRINKGIKHGLKLQATVITAKGLVGYIVRLSNNFADVLTILDSNNRVDALIQRSRSHGVVEGDISGKCTMKYVKRTEALVLDDKVITSGLGQVYPKGILIGRVTRIEKDSFGMTQTVQITPFVDFFKLEEVLVLLPESDQVFKKEWKLLDQMDK